LGFSATDPSFDPGAGANGTIKSISYVTNFVNRGRIYIGGEFTMYGNTNRAHVARLYPTGAVDLAFADPLVNSNVLATLVEPTGSLLIGGDFTAVGGAPQSRVARLTDTGTVDPSFDLALSTNPAPSTVYALALGSQLFFTTNIFTNTVGSTNLVVVTNDIVVTNILATTNQFIMAGGDFGLIRYGPDGADDTNSYTPLVFDGPVYSLAVLQTNRTILVGGAF